MISGDTMSAVVDGPSAGQRRIRVALICDFLEEGWLSMDLVGDMMSAELPANCRDLTVTQMRPASRRRLSRVPFAPRHLTLNADRLINRFVDYPHWLDRKSSEFYLFHLVDHSYSQLLRRLPRNRSVVTCHDLDTFR